MTDAVPVVVLNDTRVDLHHGCSSVMRAIEHGLRDAGFAVTATSPAHVDWAADAGFMRHFRAARLVVVNGEGTIHHDRPTGLRLLAAAAAAKAQGSACALINAMWESNGEAALAAVRGFDRISVRDSRSARELAEAGIAAAVVPDLSLCAPSPPPVPRRGVGVTDSVDRGEALRLERLRRREGYAPVSIHAVDATRPAWTFHRDGVSRSDLARPTVAIARLLARNAQWRGGTATVDAFLRDLAGLELVVSGRFHACTLALVAATPFVAAGTNSAKIRTLIADAGLDAWRADPELSATAIERARREGWSDRERAAASAFLQRARDDAAAMFSGLRQLVAA